MAFDFTCLATVQANRRSASSAAVGARRVTTRRSSGASRAVSRPWTRKPPATCRQASAGRGRVGQAAGDEQPQVLLRGEDRDRLVVASGAMTTSVKISAIAAAVAASSGPFSATMPPKAEVRSQS